MTVTNFWSGGELYTCNKPHEPEAVVSPKSPQEDIVPSNKADEVNIGMVQMGVVPKHQMAPGDGYKQFDLAVPHLNDVAQICFLCSKARFDRMDVPMGERSVIGDATESGLFKFAANVLPESDKMADQFPKVFEIPFNSTNKWHLSIHKMKHADGSLTLFIKGAPERIFRLCAQISVEGSQVAVMTADH